MVTACPITTMNSAVSTMANHGTEPLDRTPRTTATRTTGGANRTMPVSTCRYSSGRAGNCRVGASPASGSAGRRCGCSKTSVLITVLETVSSDTAEVLSSGVGAYCHSCGVTNSNPRHDRATHRRRGLLTGLRAAEIPVGDALARLRAHAYAAQLPIDVAPTA